MCFTRHKEQRREFKIKNHEFCQTVQRFTEWKVTVSLDSQLAFTVPLVFV